MTCSCRSDSSIRARTRHMVSSGTTRVSGIGWRGSGGAPSWSRRPSVWWTSASPCSLASPGTTRSTTSYLCLPKTLNFWAFVDAGRKLGDLHVGYDTVEPYPVTVAQGDLRLANVSDPEAFYRVEQMRFAGKRPKL